MSELIVQLWDGMTATWETVPPPTGDWTEITAQARATEEARRGNPARVMTVTRYPAYPVGR